MQDEVADLKQQVRAMQLMLHYHMIEDPWRSESHELSYMATRFLRGEHDRDKEREREDRQVRELNAYMACEFMPALRSLIAERRIQVIGERDRQAQKALKRALLVHREEEEPSPPPAPVKKNKRRKLRVPPRPWFESV